tara:strand:- start:330 stop:1271 length:942 start_codon:yes stop_codon:yes gene_type:complete
MEKIDAVITWVDGSEPNYQRKLKEHLSNNDTIKRQYLQANEINLCVASIVKYAPFIRKIFIVTDKQSPNLDSVKHIVSKEKIEIVDHEEIFRDNIEFLPTFNIRSIDALLFRIKDLSEKFIYFNDDMFLVKKTNPEDWFVGDKAVLTGNWVKTYNKKPIKIISQKIKSFFNMRPSFNASQSKAANIAGFNSKYFKSYHCGRPQIKSVIKDFYNKNPEKLVDQIKYKFRDDRQYMPYSLCWHLLIKKTLFIESSISKLVEIKKARELSPRQLINLLNKIDTQADIKFLNIQDLNLASDVTQQVFQKWFFKKLRK